MLPARALEHTILSVLARVCVVDLRAIGDAELAGYLAWLGPGEAARHARFVREQRRRQFLCGRVLLRRMLGQLLALDPAQIALIERPGQAPLLDCTQSGIISSISPGFSLSHSGHWVACAVSADSRLGLDIEVINSERDIDALATQAFDAADVALLQRLPLPARVPAFYRLWSEHEALYKLGSCEQPRCNSLPHPQMSGASCSAQTLSIALASAQPLSAIPLVELVALSALVC
jgi:4'-phosphopantetheinyl transferase